LQTLVWKSLLSALRVTIFRGDSLAKKPKSVEEQKKKQAYYSKGEKKAKAVKK
jgi:hypothetical protein